LQDPPKFTQIWIFGLKTNHLATLAWRGFLQQGEVLMHPRHSEAAKVAEPLYLPYLSSAKMGETKSRRPGTDVMIFKIFSPKNLAKKLAFFAQTTASFCKNCDHNIVF
jgi:hypothetical protein